MVLGDIDQNKWSLGLERVKKALERLDHPEYSYRNILIGGTNGKGSTAVYLERILVSAGYRVGTTLSPHVSSFAERFRINSCYVDEKQLVHIRDKIEPYIQDINLTYFEWCVVLAAIVFAGNKVDVSIFEVGLGGRFDASNIINPEISIITDISLDHTDYLGDNIAQIAGEKAYIARPQKPMFTAATGEALKVIRKHCTTIGAYLHEIGEPNSYVAGIKGHTQGLNAALAVQVAEALGARLEEHTLLYAFNTAFLPGRIENIGKKIILDVAHNPSSMLVLVKHLQDIGFYGVGVFGVLADKDYKTLITQLRHVCSRIYIAPVNSERSWGREQMLTLLDLGDIVQCASITEAFDQALMTDEDIVLTGSFYSVGEVRDSIICAG
jgi:dihydrofolate synthase/folylpolyglutamate synthase